MRRHKLAVLTAMGAWLGAGSAAWAAEDRKIEFDQGIDFDGIIFKAKESFGADCAMNYPACVHSEAVEEARGRAESLEAQIVAPLKSALGLPADSAGGFRSIYTGVDDAGKECEAVVEIRYHPYHAWTPRLEGKFESLSIRVMSGDGKARLAFEIWGIDADLRWSKVAAESGDRRIALTRETDAVSESIMIEAGAAGRIEALQMERRSLGATPPEGSGLEKLSCRALVAAPPPSPPVPSEPSASPAWLEAARTGRLEVLESMLPRVDVNVRTEFWGQTALMLAAEQAHYDAVIFLLRHGANVHLRGNDGKTAMDCVWRQLQGLIPGAYQISNRHYMSKYAAIINALREHGARLGGE